MTRFEQELSGALGEFWKKDAEKELAKVKEELETGKITIDEAGVARNCIGRVLMSDMLEKLLMITDRVNAEATKAAREAEVEKSINEYKEYRKREGYSPEELKEMRAAFGPGNKVVDILSGQTFEF